MNVFVFRRPLTMARRVRRRGGKQIRVAVPAETHQCIGGRSELEATERRRYEAQGATAAFPSDGKPGGDRDRSDPQTGVAPGLYPGPQYAFKISMFNVSCNSH